MLAERMHHHRSPVRRAGLTLIEVLIVIAILLAIGGLVVVNLMPAKEQADVKLQQSQFDRLDAALKLFKLHVNRYPNEEEGLAALMRKDAIEDETAAAKWQGPYLEGAIPKDHWGHDIIYRYPSEVMGEGQYDLVSLGPDGEEGTEDDITNHDRLKNAEGEIATDSDSFAPPTPPSGGAGGG